MSDEIRIRVKRTLGDSGEWKRSKISQTCSRSKVFVIYHLLPQHFVKYIFSKFKDVKITKISWDGADNTDLAKFSHILLSEGIEYAHCKTEFLRWMNEQPREIQQRIFNPPSIIQWNIDKIYLQQLRENGIRIPPTVFIPPGEIATFEKVHEAIVQEMGLHVTKDIVIKNTIGAGGYQVHLANLDNVKEAQEIFLAALNYNDGKNGLMVQEFLQTIKTEGEYGLIYFGKQFSHAVRKLPLQESFKSQGGAVVHLKDEEVPKDVLEFGEKVVRLYGSVNFIYCRVDVVRDNNGLPCLMELELFEPCLYIPNIIIATRFITHLCSY